MSRGGGNGCGSWGRRLELRGVSEGAPPLLAGSGLLKPARQMLMPRRDVLWF